MQKAERLIYLALIIGLFIGVLTFAGLGAAVYVGWGGANYRAKQLQASTDYWKSHYSIAMKGWTRCSEAE